MTRQIGDSSGYLTMRPGNHSDCGAGPASVAVANSRQPPKIQFDRARTKAKLQGRPHTLRHTFASHFLAKQPDLGLLAEILGHSEEAVARLHQHMLPERLARARNVVSIGMPATALPPPKSRQLVAGIFR